jgi:hypothetical protein
MGIGGLIKSAFHKAENVFHKAENEVKKTVKTVEKTTANQVSAFVGNVSHQIAGHNPVTQVINTARQIQKAVAPQSKGFFGKLLDKGTNLVNKVNNFGNKLLDKGNNLLNKVSDFGSKALDFGKKALTEIKDRGLDIGRSLLNVATEGVGGLVRSAFEGIGKVASGVGNMLNPAPLAKLFTGDFKGAWEDFKGNVSEGVKNIGSGLVQGLVQGPFDTLAVTLQNGISAVQTAIGVETPGRGLTDAESAELKKVYGDKVDLSQIRIKEDNIGLNNLMAPHTVGNTIYIPKGWLPDKNNPNYASQRNELLVHEAAHTWQYQNGGTDYIGASLFNQAKGAISGQSRNAAYEYDEPIKSGKSWTELNPEQQAHLIENAYVQGLFDNPNATFKLKDGSDATAYVRDAIAQMRNGKGAA